MTFNEASDESKPREIHVLDHGLVRLVDHMGSDLSISRNARVSYAASPRPEDKGLINYLLKNGHTSPFESAAFTFEVKAPIFVLRQWHRHRTWSYNEISARYKELPEEYYLPAYDKIGTQSDDNKQMRILAEGDEQKGAIVSLLMQKQMDLAFKLYRHLLRTDVPRELARTVLPLATYSHMFATVDLHNLFHFLKLRLHEHSQYEIRVYAEAMLELIEPIVPISVASFKEHVL